MSDEQRPPIDSNEVRQVERDSQLSAMFDGELSAAECELLARRLTRDEALRAQWSRYSMIGAALRAERGVKLHERVAERVQAVIAQETSYGDSAAADSGGAMTARTGAVAQNGKTKGHERWLRYARPVMGASVAAGVAAVSILWLQTQGPEPELVASTPASESVASQTIVLQPEASSDPSEIVASQPEPAALASSGEPNGIYSTPAPSSQTSIAPPARFANYVVAHSEYSGPLARRMGLMGILGTEGGADEADAAAAANPAQNSTQNPATAGDR